MLKMSIENIRRIMQDGICFEDRLSEWKNIIQTNCYAFALGLDVKEDDIYPDANAYWVGNIANLVIGTETDDEADSVERVERLLLNDFQALGINYQVFQDVDKYQYLKELEHPNDCWDILLFIDSSIHDHHFARVGRDGILYHKPGWGYAPKATSIEHIERIREWSKSRFVFEKRYRVSLR